MDFGRALSFPFDDDEWIKKFAVGSLLSLFVVPLLGYQVQVTRSVMQGKKRPIPGLDQLEQVITDGLMVFLAGLIYSAPAMIFGCMLMFAGGVLGNSELGGMLFLCLACCLSLFMLLCGIVALPLYWMGLIRYAQTGQFSEFMRLGDLWYDARRHLPILLGLLLYLFFLSLIVLPLLPFATLLCGVGLLVLLFYAHLVSGHLMGQAAREIVEAD